jgi:hypothetical protein
MIAGAGFAVRALYALVLTPDLRGLGDSAFYHGTANALADGRGFVDPATGHATALHPPLLSLLLAPFSAVGLDSYRAHRVAVCLVGAATIVAIALIVRRLAGDRAGLLAALLAAVYPAFISSDSAVMPETPFGLFVALAVLAAYAYLEHPRRSTAALLGAAIALAALTRGEGLALVVLLAAPVCIARRRVADLAIALAACALLIAPWTVRNLSTFDRAVPLSTNEGTLLAGANCPETYGGREIGSWSIRCIPPGADSDESAAAARYRREGIDYAKDHPGRLPAVAGARLRRTLGLMQPVRQAEHAEGRARGLEVAAVPAFWALALAAVYGAVLLRRRGVPVWPLAAAAALALIATLAGYGVPRFRQPADIVAVILAAVALDALLARRAGGAHDDRVGAAGAGSTTASPRAAEVRRGTSRLSDSAGRSTT